MERELVKMEENAKSQDGGDKTRLILILKWNKLRVLLQLSTYKLQVNNVCKEHILLFRLFMFSNSFTRSFSIFYTGLLFTRTVAGYNLYSTDFLTP